MRLKNILTSGLGVAIFLLASTTDATAKAPGSNLLENSSLQETLDEAIQDEYRAEQTYLKVIATFGRVRPFVNIIESERRHIKALSTLYARYSISEPESIWSQNNVPSFQSIAKACSHAVSGETKNIAMYDRLLSQNLPEDARAVLTNLQRASREAHLPAFERCAGY